MPAQVDPSTLIVQNTPRPTPHILRLALLALLLLAFALRLYNLDGSSLWSDEGNTWALMARSYAQIARDAAADIHPPGYYWLLKAWTTAAGESAFALRLFSVFAALLLISLVYRTGRIAFRPLPLAQVTALLAALLAALNPLQVYYSQEARMYMLLALAATWLFGALLAWIEAEQAGKVALWPALGYVAAALLGLWTHYSFPILLAAAALAFLVRLRHMHSATAALLRFALANLLILAAFTPWLPTAIRRVLAWPQGGVEISLSDGLHLTIQTLSTGPIRSLPVSFWPWLWIAALLPLAGLWALRRSFSQVALGLWLLAPILLMASLGLYSDAFLKFLLAASPAWSLLAAAAIWLPVTAGARTGSSIVTAYAAGLVVAALALALALRTLPTYYTDLNARDNYAGVARYVRTLANPDTSLVILDAPGQQEVWRYYESGSVPILALPATRPPNREQTEQELAAAVAGRSQLYALFWATNEADPERYVESWLDQNAFKGLESWQGNLRFAVYSLPNRLHCRPIQPSISLGAPQPLIALTEQCQPDYPQTVAAGEVALVGLRWRALAPIDRRYKVTVQLLDPRNQVIAQRDSEPAGGSQPTDLWRPQTPIVDNHGLTILPGTPPGDYRLVAALYDAETGARLPVSSGGELVELGSLQVVRPTRPIPLEIVAIPNPTHVRLGPFNLVGYALHRKDFSHAPQTPIQPGDLVHFTFFWQAPDPLPVDWPDDATFTLHVGEQTLTAPLAGGLYPTRSWIAGELVRTEFDLPYDGTAAVPVLRVGEESLRLADLPH